MLFKINFVTDKRNAEYAKDHQSTDLFLKGLHLSFFESNDLNLPDYYRTHERAETPVRKRKSPINFGIVMQNNNNQLNSNHLKLTAFNKTNDINKSSNNETDTTKIELNTDTQANFTIENSKTIKPTLTFNKAIPTNATHESQIHNNNTGSFLIRVF